MVTLNNSLFDEIVSNERNKEELFSNLEKSTNEELIGEQWMKYYHELIPLTLDLANTSKLLFQRYQDEISKNANLLTSDQDRKKTLDDNLKFTIASFFKYTMIGKLFTDISEYGLLNSRGDFNNYQYYSNIEESLAFIQNLFFSSPNIIDSLQDIAADLSIIEKSHYFDRLTHLMGDEDEFDDKLSIVQGKLKFNEANIYHKVLSKLLNTKSILSGNFELSNHFINFKATNDYNEVVTQWENIADQDLIAESDKLLLITLPLTKSRESLNKAKYFFKSAIQMARKGLHTLSNRLFARVTVFCDLILSSVASSAVDTETRLLIEEAENFNDRAKLFHGLTGLMISYRDLTKNTSVDNYEDAASNIEEIKKLINEIPKDFDVKYLSAIPGIFESISSSAELMISLKKSGHDIMEASNKLFVSFRIRIDTATTQIVQNWDTMSLETNLTQLEINTEDTRRDLDILYHATSLMPVTIDGREKLILRIEILRFFIKSIILEVKAKRIEMLDRTDELVFKAKAFYYANKSYELASSVDHRSIPFDRIRAHVSGSFVTGHLVQISISQLCSQFIYISEILPKILLAVSQEPLLVGENIDPLANLKASLAKTQTFKDYIVRIKEDTQRLIEYGEKLPEKTPQLNWTQIHLKFAMSSALDLFFASVIESLIGRWAAKANLKDQALIHFREAQELAFKAAENTKTGDPESNLEKQFGANIFSFGQFCQTSISKIEQEEQIEYPNEALLTLLRDLVFSL